MNGMTISGEAPMESGIKLKLKVRATDGYKTVEDMFVIEVAINGAYVLSVILKMIGPVAGALGVFAYANQIYNIFCKKRYTHAKIFKIKTEHPLKNMDIYPIELIGEEVGEANLIWSEILKKLKSMKKTPLSYFGIGTNAIDEDLLTKTVAEAAKVVKQRKTKQHNVQQKKTQEELSKTLRYDKQFDMNLITQILKDKLIWMQLRKDGATKQVFNHMKDFWGYFMSFSQANEDDNDCYKLVPDRFNKIIDKLGLVSYAKNYPFMMNFALISNPNPFGPNVGEEKNETAASQHTIGAPNRNSH
jgi:hypothetical protein